MNVPEWNWMRTLSVAKRPDKSLVVGLDIGTSKIVAIVGEVHEDGQVEVISLGSHPSRGLKRGVVVDIESTEQSIQRAVEEARSEEHTSELQSRGQLVCRLLLEKKKNKQHM